MDSIPSFSIPEWPRRTYPFSGGVEYEGGTTFLLVPESDRSNERLTRLVEDILETGPYRYGDFLNLPMPLYLVKDGGTDDVFRVSIRDGCIRFHVLPDTEPAGLRALYERIDAQTEVGWEVEFRTEETS